MSPRTVVFVVGPSRLRTFGVSTPCIFRILLSSADSLRMSPRTVVFVVGPSRFRAFGVSTPCIFRIFLSSADSLRMSPRIRRISVVLSEPRVSVVRSAGIPENRSHRSIPTVFTAPLRAPGPLPPGPFGAFRLLFSGPLRRHGLRISAGRLRRFPVFSLFRCGILRDPFVVSVIRFETRMSGVPPNPVVMCLAAGARLPVVSCRDEPCGRGTAPVATDSRTGSFLSVKKRCRKEEGGRPACPFELILQVKHTGQAGPPVIYRAFQFLLRGRIRYRPRCLPRSS